MGNELESMTVNSQRTATLGNGGVIAASGRANNKNGYLLFDYKYIGFDAQNDKWIFGQRVSNTNSDLYIINETIANNQWYDMKILLNGNTARLYVNGTFKAQYSYAATFSDGKVGFRAVNANTYFDNFLVSNAKTSRTTYTLGEQTIATRVTGDPMTSNNGLFYLFSDHLGSTSVLATSTGSQVPSSKTAYYPFGSPRTPPTQTITDRNFTGQKENMELGLIYYNARYYMPGSGRFLTPDTLIPNPQSPQSYNRYSYTLNNPLKFTNPSGHDPVWCADIFESAGDPACNAAQTPTPSPTATPTPNSIEQQILGATVQIIADGTFSHAVILDDNTILTHNHFGITKFQQATIIILDPAGNTICSPCAFEQATGYFINLGPLDAMELRFSGNPFSGYTPLPTIEVNDANAFIGQPIAVISYVNISGGAQSQIVWTTVVNTAYVVPDETYVPQHLGVVTGLEVEYFLPQGASGGAAVVMINGQPFLIGVNSAHSATTHNSYITFAQ